MNQVTCASSDFTDEQVQQLEAENQELSQSLAEILSEEKQLAQQLKELQAQPSDQNLSMWVNNYISYFYIQLLYMMSILGFRALSDMGRRVEEKRGKVAALAAQGSAVVCSAAYYAPSLVGMNALIFKNKDPMAMETVAKEFNHYRSELIARKQLCMEAVYIHIHTFLLGRNKSAVYLQLRLKILARGSARK